MERNALYDCQALGMFGGLTRSPFTSNSCKWIYTIPEGRESGPRRTEYIETTAGLLRSVNLGNKHDRHHHASSQLVADES